MSPPLPPKTYLLPPTFDLPPETSIRLGNLLSDPFAPHRPLASLPIPPANTATTIQTNLVTTRTKSDSLSGSVSAGLLQLVGGRLSGGVGRSGRTRFAAGRVTTRQVVDVEGCCDQIGELVGLEGGNPRVRRVLFGGLGVGRGRGRLYLIVGVKSAEGFKVWREGGVKRGVGVGGEVPLGVAGGGVDLGGEVAAGREVVEGEGYEVEGEVVIAYRVVVVKRRGWREKGVELGEYRGRDRERMLGDEEGDGDLDVEEGIEVAEMGLEGEEDEEDMGVRRVVVESEEGEVVVLSVEDEVDLDSEG
ncbi:hypothetical protein QBC41DRAFT_299500 [Cercophora samala]|uniref:Uncharacterized protein n=1 Tax=Cercophora samala TaxID=330535 RepID=A0AA40DGC9_9PEZI|nr:hypothetical protein QBC41DRAFT_299500 [Cercophora samala]